MNLKTSEQIYNHARDLYSNRLNYHNFQHIIDTLGNAEIILKQCDEKDILYDKTIICHAILFHDAGFEENHKQNGYDSKEDYSAYLASSILAESGETEQHIDAVVNAILCTKMHATCHSINENIVRAADLSGLASSYSYFKSKSIALYKEREYMTGKAISWEEYKDEVYEIINNFVQFRIELDLDMYSDGNTVFRQKVFNNLDKLMKDSID